MFSVMEAEIAEAEEKASRMADMTETTIAKETEEMVMERVMEETIGEVIDLRDGRCEMTGMKGVEESSETETDRIWTGLVRETGDEGIELKVLQEVRIAIEMRNRRRDE